MRTKKFLAAICLCMALCIQAYNVDTCAAQSGECRQGAFRGWLKACLTVKCKTPPWCPNPPAAAADATPAAPEAPKDAPKPDAPKTEAAPVTPLPPAPPAVKTGS